MLNMFVLIIGTPTNQQAGTKLGCYNRLPTQNECANFFDLSACTDNVDCKVGCNPRSNPPGLCPDLSPCPDTGCCDPRPGPRPGPRPNPTLKECVDALSCETDPMVSHPSNYTCDLQTMTNGTCRMNEHCQSIVNNNWPIGDIGSGYYNEYTDDDPPEKICPKVSNVWDNDWWDHWTSAYNDYAITFRGEEIPAQYCKDASPNGWWSNPRCKIQHGDFSGSIGSCTYNPYNDPYAHNGECLPIINNCATCDHELADVCKKKFPFQIGRECNN